MGKTKTPDHRNQRNPYARFLHQERVNGEFRLKLVEPKKKLYKREPNLTKKVNDGTFFEEELDNE